MVPQTAQTIGDLLSVKGVRWTWYAGAWQAALDGQNSMPTPNFQYHHQPFNYFATMAPGTAARAEHLKDAGLGRRRIHQGGRRGDLTAGHVLQAARQSERASRLYRRFLSGDKHIADIVAHLEKSPQWEHMLVIVTYDDNGGFWDHVGSPKADRWGPGSRVPALIISPFARKGFVDHTLYDTTSILRFITRRFDLPVLPGLKARDAAMAAAGSGSLGDLTAAPDLSSR